MTEAELIERLRGPTFGTPTALDAATAIETWKTRAERLADMHRDMCVVAGEAVARAETAEATLAALSTPAAPELAVKDGWVLVPRNPTPDMLVAAGTIEGWNEAAARHADECHIEWWQAMLAAAPVRP